jgi:ATP/maltotriose-dependent transcriptional regulator MalT
MAGPLLALLVDVLLEQGDLEDATRVAGRLERMAGRQRGPYLRAAAALAKGRVCLAGGQIGAEPNRPSGCAVVVRLPSQNGSRA